jgi:modulator of FtsH protease HflK
MNQNPWNDKNESPPELDKLIANFVAKLKAAFSGKKSGEQGGESAPGSKLFIWLALAVLVIIWIAAGFFIVKPAEEAVVLRFGKYQETKGPGPHWVPRLIYSYEKVNVQQVNSFSFDADYLTKSSGDSDKPPQVVDVEGANGAPGDDTDKNVVYVELSVQYRITDPQLYLFNIVDPTQTLQQAAHSALSQVIGTMTLNGVLTVGRDQLADEVRKRLEGLMKQYQTGITVVVANVRKAQAPEEVADAFLDVVQAGQDEQRYIQQAQAYASKVVPIANGVKSRILATAQGYQQQVVLDAQAQVAGYLAQLSVYKKAPAVTQERLYLDVLENVLANTNKVLVDVDSANNLLYLPLDQLKQAVNKSTASNASAADALLSSDGTEQDINSSIYGQQTTQPTR